MLLLRSMFFLCATIPFAHAQLTYSYRGNRLSGQLKDGDQIHGQTLSAKLVTDEIIPADTTSPPDYRGAKPCPGSWTFAIEVGGTVYESRNANRATCSYVGSIGNPLLPAYLYLELQQGSEEGMTMHFCSHPHYRTFDTLPCRAPFRDPNVDWIELYGPNIGPAIHSPNTQARAESGTWSAPDPADVAAELLNRVIATPLSLRLISAQKNIRDGNRALACTDLQTAANLASGTENAATTQRWLAYISAGVKCPAK